MVCQGRRMPARLSYGCSASGRCVRQCCQHTKCATATHARLDTGTETRTAGRSTECWQPRRAAVRKQRNAARRRQRRTARSAAQRALRQPSAVAQANAQEEPRGTRQNWPPDGKAEDGAGGQPERGYACPAARQPRRWLSGVPRCWCVAPAAGHTVAMLHQFGSGATACANSTRATVVSWRAATRYPSRRNWARRSRSRSRVSASTRIEICRRGPA